MLNVDQQGKHTITNRNYSKTRIYQTRLERTTCLFFEVCCWSRQTPICFHSKQLYLYRILYIENSALLLGHWSSIYMSDMHTVCGTLSERLTN